MNKKNKSVVIVLGGVLLISFTFFTEKTVEFSYPKRDKTTIKLTSDKFKKFSKEWRGQDYYYLSEGKEGFVCSVLYYKLNDEEKMMYVDLMKAALGVKENSPAFPLSYFRTSSNLKKYEVNDTAWGAPTDDFMFRQNDIKQVEGTAINQKHMYGYCMTGDDIFVNIHLSKILCTPQDSTIMRQIMASLSKEK